MERGLYIAASGMLAEQARQDQIASDLANASTPGYKAERSGQRSFGELLLANEQTGRSIGPLGLGPTIGTTRMDLRQAPLRRTDEPLHVALQGEGFLSVRTPQGIRYTRDGQLALDGRGRLVTSVGHPILDARGREIQLPRSRGVTIDRDGAIAVGGKAAGTLALVSLKDAERIGDGLFAGTPAGRASGTEVLQGHLEGSGVNAARTMVDMIASLRAFEASQRVIRAIDETLQRGISAGGTAPS